MNADERRLVVSYSLYFYFIVFIINSLYKSGAVMKSLRAVHRAAPRLCAGEGGEAGGGEGESEGAEHNDRVRNLVGELFIFKCTIIIIFVNFGVYFYQQNRQFLQQRQSLLKLIFQYPNNQGFQS